MTNKHANQVQTSHCKPSANLVQTLCKPCIGYSTSFESDKNSKYQQAQEYISEIEFTLSLSCLILHSQFLQALCKPALGKRKHLVGHATGLQSQMQTPIFR